MDLTSGLNPAQKKAVEHSDGPLMIVAGAGTGKTKTLTHRIASLIAKGIQPSSILAVTFTNKAAREMRERVAHLLSISEWTPYASDVPFIGTFHSLSVRLLRESGSAINIRPSFAIYDRDDSVRAMRDSIKEAGGDPKEFPPSMVLGYLSRLKSAGITEDELTEARSPFEQIAHTAGRLYAKRLRDANALDFDDLLVYTKKLLEKAEVAERYRARWSHVHVDEYQDTNRIQEDIIKELLGDEKNICVVGDADQSIYGWRSADVRIMLDFEKTYPNADIITLEENYRSTDVILGAANEVIDKNIHRTKKNLFTSKAGGERIHLHQAFTEMDEARHIAESVRVRMREGVPAGEIVILFRTNVQSRVLEEAMLAHDIPYHVVGTRFFDREEVRHVLAYLSVALNPENTSAYARIANVPARGIGKVSLMKIVSGLRHELTGKARESVENLDTILAKIRSASKTLPPSELIRTIINESGLENMYASRDADDAERVENMHEVATVAARYDALPAEVRVQAFMDEMALLSDQDTVNDKTGAVRLMTVHAAKGLEFDVVFVAGMEEGLFPHERSSDAKTLVEREEERRLFYVAITRARKELWLSYAALRTVYGSQSVTVPSSFLDDIPEELIDTAGEEGGWGEGLLTID